MSEKIEEALKQMINKQCEKDSDVKAGAFHIVSSKKKIDVGIGYPTQDRLDKPFYMASVGKLFTSTLIGILVEQGKLAYDQHIESVLDDEVLKGLFIYDGQDVSNGVTLQHLLTHRSGLDDAFFPLVEHLKKYPDKRFSQKALLDFVKENISMKHPVGKKVHYADTNYYLLGFVIENITGLSLAEVMHQYIFKPLNMKHSYLLHQSEPSQGNHDDVVSFDIKGLAGDRVKGYADIDYAGGSVISTMSDLQLFMRALKAGTLVSVETLNMMCDDAYAFFPGLSYGYGVWNIKPTFLMIPKSFKAWGVIGVLGAFMFYHPETETILIGTFNHTKYEKKSVRFTMKMIKTLLKS